MYELERKYRAILDHTFEFIGLLTPDGTLIEANRAALTTAGVKESDVLGQTVLGDAVVDPFKGDAGSLARCDQRLPPNGRIRAF